MKLKNLFKKKQNTNRLSDKQIAAFETLRIKNSLELETKDIAILEPEEKTHLVISYKGKGIAALYKDTFITSANKFSGIDRQNVNKILDSVKKHYE